MSQLESTFKSKIWEHCSKLKKVKKLKNNLEKNRIQLNLIKSGLRDLQEEFEDMSEQEKKIENPNEIVDIVENILEF